MAQKWRRGTDSIGSEHRLGFLPDDFMEEMKWQIKRRETPPLAAYRSSSCVELWKRSFQQCVNIILTAEYALRTPVPTGLVGTLGYSRGTIGTP